MYYEIIDTEAKSYSSNKFYLKNITCKTQNFHITLAFSLITISLLIAVSIYCYLITYQTKQKHLLPFHVRNNELIKVLY